MLTRTLPDLITEAVWSHLYPQSSFELRWCKVTIFIPSLNISYLPGRLWETSASKWVSACSSWINCTQVYIWIAHVWMQAVIHNAYVEQLSLFTVYCHWTTMWLTGSVSSLTSLIATGSKSRWNAGSSKRLCHARTRSLKSPSPPTHS